MTRCDNVITQPPRRNHHTPTTIWRLTHDDSTSSSTDLRLADENQLRVNDVMSPVFLINSPRLIQTIDTDKHWTGALQTDSDVGIEDCLVKSAMV